MKLSSIFGSLAVLVMAAQYHGGWCQSDGFLKDCLDAHNKLRRKHGVPDLVWDDKLATEANTEAQNLADDGALVNEYIQQTQRVGELLGYWNIFFKKCLGEKEPGCTQCREIVNDWYNAGKEAYDYQNPRTDFRSFHFSQIVWKGSRRFGFGTATSDGGLVSVARYSPEGNIQGNYQENVLPSKEKPKESGKKTGQGKWQYIIDLTSGVKSKGKQSKPKKQ